MRVVMKYGLGLAAVAVLALLVVVVVRRSGRVAVPDAYRYDVESYRDVEYEVDVPYRRVARIPLALRAPRGVAAYTNGIAVVGDEALLLLGTDGTERERVVLAAEPAAVAARGDSVYVAVGDHIRVFGTDGSERGAWPSLGERAMLTSLAAGNGGVCAADFGQVTVWRLDSDGRLRDRIGARGPEGFLLPSPSFDVAVGGDTVWVTNPGKQQVEAYDPTGKRTRTWGRSSMELDGFCGCCNPMHLALLPDGRVVTAEKGLQRVKLYSATGEFDCLVAGGDAFGDKAGLDLAVDAAGRILVLDAAERCIKVFGRRK